MSERVTDLRQSRRNFLVSMGAAGALLSGCASRVTPALEQSGIDSRVERIVADTISVDMHNHVAMPSFAKTAADARPDPVGDLAGELRKSGFTAVCVTHAINAYRMAQVGDWYQYHLQLLAYTDRLLAANGMRRALTASDLRAAHRARASVVIQSVEGGQWIEGRIDRIGEAYGRGLRHLQLLHQLDDLVAPLGGVQQNTGRAAAPTLTAVGADVVRECNRLGIVVDMAHANEATVLAALKASSRPLVVSHTALDTPLARSADIYRVNPGLAARLVSVNYAKAVADAGGIIGIWRLLPTMKDYVTALRQLADVVGVDHTGIGTDTSLMPPAPPNLAGLTLTNKTWPDQTSGFVYSLAQEMLNQGFRPDEISKIAGGNYLRVLGAATSSRG
ncbi:MAG: membrane dipeptidase [Burkholderiales bacterium]|nr:membrane dipeptidase [Burkholderiales bacterium]